MISIQISLNKNQCQIKIYVDIRKCDSCIHLLIFIFNFILYENIILQKLILFF